MGRWAFATASGASALALVVACKSFGADPSASPTTDAGVETTTDGGIVIEAATDANHTPTGDGAATNDDCVRLPEDTICVVKCGTSFCSSCSALLANHAGALTGFYRIDGVTEPVDVFCDMTTEGGGWMMIARSEEKGEADGFGWFSSTGDVMGVDEPYSLDVGRLTALPTTMLFGLRGDGREWGAQVYLAPIPSGMLAASGTAQSFSLMSTVKVIKGGCTGGYFQQHTGLAGRSDAFFFRDNAGIESIFGLKEDGWDLNGQDDCEHGGDLDTKAGMIFVR